MSNIKYILLLLILNGLAAHAQTVTDTIFLDKGWNKCSRDTFTNFRLAKKQGDTYIVRDYYHNGHIASDGTHLTLDSDSKEGPFRFYFQSGHKQADGVFHNNKKNGEFLFYSDTTGMLMCTITFKAGRMNGPAMTREKNDYYIDYIYSNDTVVHKEVMFLDKNYLNSKKDLISGEDILSGTKGFGEVLKRKIKLLIPDSIKNTVGTVIVNCKVDINANLQEMLLEKSDDKQLADIVMKTIRETWGVSESRPGGSTRVFVSVAFPTVDISVAVRFGFKEGEFHLKYTDQSTAKNNELAEYFKEKYGQSNLHGDTSANGTVKVKFDTDNKGKAQNIELLWGSDNRLVDFLIDNIEKSKAWKPSRLQKSKYQLTVKFPDMLVTSSIAIEQ